MVTRNRLTVAALASWLALSLAAGEAPRSKDVPRPVETAPGTITDGNSMLKVDLDLPASVVLKNQPMLLAFNKLQSVARLNFGYKGVNPEELLTANLSGTVRDVLVGLGEIAGIRYEVVGPSHLRVMKARTGRVRKPPAEPPPATGGR